MILINPMDERTKYTDKDIMSLFDELKDLNVWIDDFNRITIKTKEKYPMRFYILNPTKKVLDYLKPKNSNKFKIK